MAKFRYEHYIIIHADFFQNFIDIIEARDEDHARQIIAATWINDIFGCIDLIPETQQPEES